MQHLEVARHEYPDKPGYRDTDTSKAAAEGIAWTVASIRAGVLAALCIPMTDWELATALELPFERVQPRRSELYTQGKVKFSGEYGISGRSKSRAKKWVQA